MQNYELLLVLPGTFSEEEVKPVVDQVVVVLTEAGAQGIIMSDKGKSRLAYPMKHIRYGYFQLGYFEAEPASAPIIQSKLRLMSSLLRVQLNKFSDKAVRREEKMVAISDVTIRSGNTEKPVRSVEREKKGSAEERAISEVRPIKSTDKKKAAPTKGRVETKVENVKMEDIDKKLDELLDSGISDV
jgi:small subunit ribosomal protein S6